MDLEQAKEVFARHAGDYRFAYIFGSVADGTADAASDLDVLVVRETSLPFFERVREIMDLRMELGNADLLIYTPAELDEMCAEPGRYFVKQIVAKGYRIEGQQGGGAPLAPPS